MAMHGYLVPSFWLKSALTVLPKPDLSCNRVYPHAIVQKCLKHMFPLFNVVIKWWYTIRYFEDTAAIVPLLESFHVLAHNSTSNRWSWSLVYIPQRSHPLRNQHLYSNLRISGGLLSRVVRQSFVSSLLSSVLFLHLVPMPGYEIWR